MREDKDSSAVELMAHLWDHRQERTGHSWLMMNQGMREGLMLAVKLGLEFHEGDLGVINKRFRGGYWFGDNLESFYTCAVVYNNRSAWKAYEFYTRRIPFILTPARLRETWGGGGQGINNLPRLTVGCEFQWKNEIVKITSFNDANASFTAQSYAWNKSEDCKECGHPLVYPKQKIVHRYTITHDDLKAAKKEKKMESKNSEERNV